MGSKGIASSLGEILTGLFVLALVAFGIMILLQTFTEIHVMVSELGVNRHNIALANVILSSSDIVHEQVGMKRRALIDSAALGDDFISDSEMSSIADAPTFIAKSTQIFTENGFFSSYSYPGTYYILILTDLETGEKWLTLGHGPGDFTELNVPSFLACVWNQYTEAVEIPSVFDLQECGSEAKSDSGISKLTYPTNILVGTDIHIGKMELLSMEV
jgi:hypothetical protein